MTTLIDNDDDCFNNEFELQNITPINNNNICTARKRLENLVEERRLKEELDDFFND